MPPPTAHTVAFGPVLLTDLRISDPGAPARAAARSEASRLLRTLGAADPRLAAHCEVCGSDEHGRPIAASRDVLVSIAYASDRVVVAATPATTARALGVDIEPARTRGPMPQLAALFAPHDPPDVRAWTAIEAALKADGRGLRIPPHLVVEQPDRPGGILPGSHRIAVPGRGIRIEVADAPAPDGFVVSVAIDPGP